METCSDWLSLSPIISIICFCYLQELHIIVHHLLISKFVAKCFIFFFTGVLHNNIFLGECYLTTHATNLGNNIEETESLLREHNEFKGTAKETRERVKLLIQLADSLVEKGHAHASAIKQWVAAVDNRYLIFNTVTA